MEGINILYSEPIMTIPDWAAILAIILVLSIYLSLMAAICTGCNSYIPLCLNIISLIGLCVLVRIDPQVSTNRTRYEVTIDKSVSMEDVYEKYEVIEHKGEIWILEDKEVDK